MFLLICRKSSQLPPAQTEGGEVLGGLLGYEGYRLYGNNSFLFLSTGQSLKEKKSFESEKRISSELFFNPTFPEMKAEKGKKS